MRIVWFALTLWLFATIVVPIDSVRLPAPPACGYSSCPKSKAGAINVHLVSHTHDDVGWLKTVDQYYYGEKNSVQRAGVQYILNTVIDELEKDANRRFIYVESEFLHQWWRKQTNAKRAQVRKLVDQGRLEFIGGGWTMNDEAAAHYISIIDQMTLGHRFLRGTFGRCAIPRVAWQIDPFGHSREQASLFAQMDFDGLFFGRLDWQEKKAREKNLSMESLWVTSSSLSRESSSLFTGVLPNGYNPPSGFCFDDTCEDEPIVDSADSYDYNVPQKVKLFLEHVSNQSKWYASSNLIMTMGSDFQYQNANPWFENLDKLISLVNSNQDKVNVMYSTPSCYLKALNDADQAWPIKTDDFFPYSSDPHSFWAGYFTSRPTFKRHERESSALLQACKQLQVLGNLTSIFDQAKMGVLADAVGISQHHDAITGTEKQHVYSDYVRRLADGEQSCISLSVQALQNIEAQHSKASDIEMPKRTASPTALFACRSLNVSQCDLSEQMQPSNTDESRLPIVIYNQLARMRVETLRIPLINPDPDRFQLINSSGSSHSFTLQPIPDQIQRLPERNSKATHELVFAAHLKPLGVTRYTLIQTQSSHVGRSPKVPNVKPNPESLAGKGFTLDLDPETLLPISITLTDKNQTIEFQHSLRYYPAMAGNNRKFENRASGAYIFRPNATRSLPIADNNIPKATFTQHGQWQHLELSYANYSFETIRIHPQLEHIEFDYLVGPIPIGDNVGREIVSEYRTSIESERLFWTDSNGRQDVLRQRNHRQTYTYDSNLEPVASNYYPINARVTIRDRTDDVVMSVLVDRSCGGASLQDGQLEVMLHRRLLFDDSFGVDEALNEPGTDGKGLIVRGRHWVHVGRRQQAVKFARLRSPQLTLPPLILFGRPGAAESDLMNLSKQVIDRSALHRSIESGLPDAVNLLTVELFPKNRVLVRLEHLYEKNELPDQKPIRIDLRQLFDERLVGHMVSAVETSLSASHARGTIKRLKWKTDDDHNELVDHKWNDRDSELKTKRKSFFYDRLFTPGRPQEDEFDAEMKWMECMAVGDFVVTLKPMQIRSYLVRLSGIDNSTDLRPNCPWNS